MKKRQWENKKKTVYLGVGGEIYAVHVEVGPLIVAWDIYARAARRPARRTWWGGRSDRQLPAGRAAEEAPASRSPR